MWFSLQVKRGKTLVWCQKCETWWATNPRMALLRSQASRSQEKLLPTKVEPQQLRKNSRWVKNTNYLNEWMNEWMNEWNIYSSLAHRYYYNEKILQWTHNGQTRVIIRLLNDIYLYKSNIINKLIQVYSLLVIYKSRDYIIYYPCMCVHLHRGCILQVCTSSLCK